LIRSSTYFGFVWSHIQSCGVGVGSWSMYSNRGGWESGGRFSSSLSPSREEKTIILSVSKKLGIEDGTLTYNVPRHHAKPHYYKIDSRYLPYHFKINACIQHNKISLVTIDRLKLVNGNCLNTHDNM